MPVNAHRYDLEGTVVSVEPAKKEVTLAHKDIPGFMKAMTMPFKVAESAQWTFNVMKPGDYVHATLVVTDDDSYVENLNVNKQDTTQIENTTSSLNHLDVGQVVPEFVFINQDGKPVSLKSFHGSPVLLTFIYSRCPLPDYCIRMSSNFREIAGDLKKDHPDAWKSLHLLSISFDPDFDKPSVLRAYGRSYAGEVDSGFKHWQFVTASPREIRRAADFFSVVYDLHNQQYVHSLRTVLIGKDGKIAAIYPDNNWKPSDVVEDVLKQK